MSLKVEFFNTPNVEGRKILEYKGIVQASQVAGTGFFTDIFASISDFLGTNSFLYADKMNVLQENLLLQLEYTARSKGANAVVGVHIDFDSISNNGSSMFMASAQGTAVVLENQKQHEVVKGEVDYRMLEQKVLIKNITPKLVNYTYLSEEEWNLIIDSADISIAKSIHKIYLSIDKTMISKGSERWEWVQNYERYFMRLPYEKQVELAYTTTTELPLIQKFNLFDASKVLLWAKNGQLTFAIDCLKATKISYTRHDVYEMKELLNYLTNLPNKGKREEVKVGINPSEIQDAEEYYNYINSMPNAGQIVDAQNEAYSSKVTHFICECGRKNDGDEEFCKSCGKNIKGLTIEQVELIEKLKQKISILEELLDE